MLKRMIFSVTDINTYVQKALQYDDLLQNASIRGEVSNCRMYPSGHIYFSMKDDMSLLRCVWFKGNRTGKSLDLKDGMRIIAKGGITLYIRDGQYQLNVQDVRPDGVGAWYERYHAIKVALQSEGLFDPSHKRLLPRFPRCVGVVTSEQGAAIRDIIRVATRRYTAARLLLHPVAVQGEGAAEQIARAIHGFHLVDGVDVLIVGRGGGSIEDLWAFNEPCVARAIYDSSIPVISAVGHEIDETIADFVADVRAATPSNAAELAFPDVREVIHALNVMARAMERAVINRMDTSRRKLEVMSRMLEAYGPSQRMDEYGQRLDHLMDRMDRSINHRIQMAMQQIGSLERSLTALDPHRVLDRGYAIIQHENGHTLQSVRDMHVDDPILIRMKDGKVPARVRSEHETGGNR